MKLYAESVLIGTRWCTEKTIEWDKKGTIVNISDGRAEDAIVAKGPVIPGMVNCHSHAFQRAFAGFSEYRANPSDSFWSWRDIMYRFVSVLSPDDVATIAAFLYQEMLQAGYTSVAEFHYLHHDRKGIRYQNKTEMSERVILAAQESGIAITQLPVLYSWSGFGEKAPNQGQLRFTQGCDEFMELVSSLKGKYSHSETVNIGIAPHSLRAVSKQQLSELLPAFKSLAGDAPLHIHIAEQQAEVKDCIEFYGQRPVAWFAEQFGLGDNLCLIHATHLTAEERQLIAKSNSVAGICPTTESNLGDGIFPTSEFVADGGQFAIGSDSHIAVNVADELRTLEYCQRLVRQQRAVLCDNDTTSVGTWLYSNAANAGAQAIGQNVGTIERGKRADLVVLDENNPAIFSKSGARALDAAVFASPQLPVRDVWVGGKQVVIDGYHPQQSDLTDAYRQTLEKIVAQL